MASLTVTNHTPAALSEISVVLYKDPCLIQVLAPGESSVCAFEIESDSHYRITWQESGSGSYVEEVGYVTHGFDFEHELGILGAGKVSFRASGNP